MLVDNGVLGDSRVQKQAESAAARGWEVFLLGRSKQARRWKIGEARVRLLPFESSLGKRVHEHRPGYLRHPLSYRNRKLAENKVVSNQASKRILDSQIALSTTTQQRFKRKVLSSARLARALQGRWVMLRARATQRVHSDRREMTSPLDRFTTAALKLSYGDSAWRKLDPELLEFEAVYGPEIDRLRPDIIHANDFRMLGVGARATWRARAAGRDVKLVWDAHEFLPGLKPWSSHPRWHVAQILHERQFAQYADAVVTVTDPLAELLKIEHNLPETPTVVLNAPLTAQSNQTTVADIRTRAGVPAGAPLLVYSGAAAPQRGLDTMVEGLQSLPETHIVFVVRLPANEYAQSLVEQARQLGVADRLHLVDYVPVEQIVPFLSTATIGVIPAHKWPNHEISLGTKFFEYSHARLPIVTSNLKAMATMVQETGQGEVFLAEDTADYVRAVRKVLADLEGYRRAYDDAERLTSWTWERQAEVLDGVYQSLRDQQGARQRK